MQLITLMAILFFVISLFMIFAKKINFLYYFPLILVLYDTFFLGVYIGKYFFHDTIAILILFFFISAYATKSIKYFKINWWIVLFFILSILKLADSENIMRSTLSLIKILGSMMMIFVGFTNIKSLTQLDKLNKTMIYILFIFILNFIYSNLFKIGADSYSIGIYAGNLFSEMSFVAIIPLLLIPYLIIRKRFLSKQILIGALVIALVIFLMLLRRTPIMMILSGFITMYLIYASKRISTVFKSIFYVILFVIALNSIFPNVVDNYISLFDLRGRSLSTTSETIEKEGRIIEIQQLFQNRFTFKDVKASLVGDDYFYSKASTGKYAENLSKDRPMHTILTMILYYTGLLGLLIYLMIQVKIIKWGIKLRNLANKHNKEYLILYSLYLSLISVLLLSNMSKGLVTPTFSITIFLYLGALTRILLERNTTLKYILPS